MMKVLYLGGPENRTHPWNGEFFKALDERFPVTYFDPTRPAPSQFEGVDFVLDPGGQMGTRERIALAREAGVRLWQVTTNGLDHVDVAYFLEQGLPLANTPGPMSAVALAEHALFFMFCLAKKLSASQKAMATGEYGSTINDDLEGKTLLIIGLGASGRELARRAAALDMRVLAVDVFDMAADVLARLGVEFCGGLSHLERLLPEADYVSLHTPLTSKTRHLINARTLGLMKPTAHLINIARGSIVDEAALVDALQSGRLAGAGLDVFEVEPADPANPLLHMENVIATPHRAGVTWGTARRRGQTAAENVARLARGEAPLCLVAAVE
jgi:phosphoglycerate dehydrogenase-like enzyme